MSNVLPVVVMSGLQVALNVAALRAVPVVFAFHASAQQSRQAIGALACFACLMFVAVRWAAFDVFHTLTAYAYLLVASATMYFAGRRGLRIVRFGLSWFVFLLAPTLLWPDQGLITFLGWDLAMSCFSYCVEVPPARFDWGQYLFFMFVNPTVTYPSRGTRVAAPGFHARAARRSARGIAGLAASGALTAAAAHWRPTTEGLGAVVARLVAMFLAHLSLAALQIGLMRQVGYVVPERYRGLLSVRTPAQFWTRWNSYFGTWAKRYIFVPCVQSSKNLSHKQRNALAVVATFACMGALHDLFAFAQNRELSTLMLEWFVANAVLVIVWQWCTKRCKVAVTTGPSWQFARTLMFVSCFALLAASLP